MLVASNTSPISNLAVINRLDLLRNQFQEIWIPTAVELELRDLPHSTALASIEQAIRGGWIKPRSIDESQLHQTSLDRGEAEAIQLGIELHADLILLDETDGRRAAERAGLKVTGILGVLLRAKERGQIPRLKPELEALRNRARFFIAPRLAEQVLRSAGE